MTKSVLALLLALLAAPVVAVADDDAVAETGKWRHFRSETALETADYLLLDAEVEGRIWTLARRCNLDQAWIQSSVSRVGEALDYSLSYVEYRNEEWVRLYKTRIRQDENPIKEWTWRYTYNADLGIEALTLDHAANIDKILLGNRFVMEISPARGVAVFDTRGFGEAFNMYCPNGIMWTQMPARLVGTYFNSRGTSAHSQGTSVRPIPPYEDQKSALAARVTVANHNGKDGIALQVLDPFDWHGVAVVIIGNDGNWLFQWPGLMGEARKMTAHIPFEYFKRVGVRRYWRTGYDEIEAVVIVAYVPVSWSPDPDFGVEHSAYTQWTAGDGYREYEETPARFVMKSPIPTVTWEEASSWPEDER